MKSRNAQVWPHVALNITRRCNQRCVFCFEGDRADWPELDQQEIFRLLEDATASHANVIFMGGEALLRRDILDIIRHARGLGLTLSIFTNGQPLGRPGFIEELAGAGLTCLDISFHYADEEAFARGTGTKAHRFSRLLQGLGFLREYNRAHPESPILIHIETDLHSQNAGSLMEIRRVLQEALGEFYLNHRLGMIRPGADTGFSGSLLEPFAERREEMVHFLSTTPPGVSVALGKMPLCLAPGYEHQSLDLLYKLEDTHIISNFDDKEKLGQMHRHEEDFDQDPYRWVCLECNLLPLCPVTRTSWVSPTHTPTRDQRPVPERVRTVREVVGRLYPDGELPEEKIARVTEFWAAKGAPERSIVDQLKQAGTHGVRLLDAYCGEVPLLDLDLSVDGELVRLFVQTLRVDDGTRGREMGHLVRYFDVSVETASPEAERVGLKAIRHFASLPLPPLEAWGQSIWMDLNHSRAAEALWQVFGGRLWPGIEVVEGWVNRGLQWSAEGALWRLESSTGDRVTLLLSTPHFPIYLSQGVSPLPPEDLVQVKLLEAEGDPEIDALLRELERVAWTRGAKGRAAPVSPEPSPGDQFEEQLPREEEEREEQGVPDESQIVRVVFSDRQRKLPDIVFLLEPLAEGGLYFLRAADIGIWHPQDERLESMGRPLAKCGKLLAGTVERLGPLANRPLDRWAEALRMRLARSPAARRFEFSAAVEG